MFGRRSRFAKLELPFHSLSTSSPASLLSRLRNGKRFWFWPVRIIGILGVLLTLYFLLFHHSNLRIVRLSPGSQNLAFSGYAEKHTKPPAKQHSLESHIDHLHDVQRWQLPPGMRVIGLVFYGRRRFVSILSCYLKVSQLLEPTVAVLCDLADLSREIWLRTGVSSTSIFSSSRQTIKRT